MQSPPNWRGPAKRPGNFDRWYVESHLLDRRDVFLTDDVGNRTIALVCSTSRSQACTGPQNR